MCDKPTKSRLPRKAGRRFALLLFSAIAAGGLGLAGCGGGSSSNNNNNGNNGGNTNINLPASASLVSGTTTDSKGSPIVGASVSFNGQTATSTQLGTYVLPNVPVAAGQSSVVGVVTASATIAGRNWTGQNMVEVLNGEPDTSNIQIVLSPVNTQGAISGTVSDAQNRPLRGARVFAAIGPFADSNMALGFDTLASFAATTDSNGAYTLPMLPPDTEYTVTASFAGYQNQTVSHVAVASSAQATALPFTLTIPSASPLPPAVTGFTARAFTTPAVPTRSTSSAVTPSGFAALRRWILARQGLLNHHRAVSARAKGQRSVVRRSTPPGYLIEADLFWDYVQINNLYGYDILLATDLNNPNFASIATVRDPLAARFSDLDLTLTPDVLYYYSLTRLDTINFPKGDLTNGVGPFPGSGTAAARAVQPLNTLALTSPQSGTTAASLTPTFSWSGVSRAALYNVLVYDRFPNLQSDTDTANGVQPIWSASVAPGATGAPATSQIYQGPVLVSGHTYYWAVIAQDNVAADFSVSPLQTFIAP